MNNHQESDYSWVWWVLGIGVFLLFLFFNNSNSSSDSPQSYVESESDSYSDEDETSDTPEYNDDEESDLEYKGYDCTDDCSGHEAGYEWAEENGITQDDVDGYSGNSDSFQEGMQSYVDENY